MRCGPYILLLVLFGCDQMESQPRYDPYAPSPFYADGASARPRVAGTVARGESSVPPATDSPFALTSDELHRGRQQFDIFCAVCHGRTGDGNGMIPARGFTKPPSYFEKRLIDSPTAHFVEVMSNGYGAMYGLNDRIDANDRWRIAAYIRALQLSRTVKIAQLNDEEKQRLPQEKP